MAKFATSGNAVRVVAGAVTPELELDWERLYDVHAPKLRRIISRRVGASLAEDVLQETFLQAFKSRATIDPTRSIEPWLITIALRAATEAHRRQLRTVETTDAPDLDCHATALDSLEEELLSRARRMGIRHAFASLNTRQRRLLQLVTLEGMSYEGAAGVEDMTTDAVKSALARARTNFKTSYMGFEKESKLFGGAVAFGLFRRLRGRLFGYQAYVGGHIGGLGAAAATVAVVAVAIAPMAAQSPTQAREIEHTVAASSGAGAPMFVDLAVPARATATAGSTDQGSPNTPNDPGIGVRSGVGRSGSTASAAADSTIAGPTTDRRSYATVTFDCNQGGTGALGCAAVEELEALLPGN